VRGQYVSAIDLQFDPATKRIIKQSARNVVVQSEAYSGARGTLEVNPEFPAFAPRTDLATLAKRYADAAKKDETRVIGTLAGAATRDKIPSGESLLGNLIADAQLAATRDPKDGGAQIAFMNPDGLRIDVVPQADGTVTFGSVFAAQPFSNQLIVKTMTGAQIREVLEQQFINPNWIRVLSPSTGFRFAYDMSRPEGQRVLAMTLHGAPLRDDQPYRVAISDFLSNGGDLFAAFTKGTNATTSGLDIDALIAWLSRGGVTALPALDRVENKGPVE
jgi:5'-nucleotidase